jgi:hypothetical protein
MELHRHMSVLLVALCMAAAPVCAQQAGKTAAPAAAFSPRDLSGVWARAGGSRGSAERVNRTPVEGPDSQWSSEKLPFTPEGRAIFDTNRPADGPRQVKGEMPVNDPRDTGNPLGLYRALRFSSGTRVMEMGNLHGNIVQLISVGRIFRIIYMDGRAVPEQIVAGPFWYGQSVGRWDGDTLVVTTQALDDRQWLDDWGTPISLEARIEERWRRVAPDEVQMTFTVNDPVYYTKPWTTPTATFILRPKAEPDETIYAPADMVGYSQETLLPSSNQAKQ